MKKRFLLLSGILLTNLLQAQIQEMSVGVGYQRHAFVNLATGTEKQVLNTAWDIAFTVYGQQDAGVFINEASGSSNGQAQAQVELYDARTENFSDQPNPATLTDFRLYNSERTWAYGAFNELREPNKPFDYGWGQYNPQTNQITGKKVYVIKLRNGQFRKFKVESLIGVTYTFKYANLDGSGEVTKTISKTQHAGKSLAYFSFSTGATVDAEPANGFDLLYCRYVTSLFDAGSNSMITYNLTGILQGRGVSVAKAVGVNPATVQYNTYKDSLKTQLDVIGHDWKTFSGTSWSIEPNRVYFLKTAAGRVWKLQFIDFEGSSTGNTIIQKTDLGLISNVQDPAAIGMSVLAYPNPVQEQLTVSLDLPAEWVKPARLEVTDLQGRLTIAQDVDLQAGFQALELPAVNWTSGVYILRLRYPNQDIKLGQIIKL